MTSDAPRHNPALVAAVALLLLPAMYGLPATANDWEVAYEASDYPESAGWQLRGGCEDAASVAGGILYLDTENCSEQHGYYIEWDPGEYWTCELRVKEAAAYYGTNHNPAAVNFQTEHGENEVSSASIGFYVDKVMMCVAGYSSCFVIDRWNLTFQTYRICLHQDTFEVYHKLTDSPETWEEILSKRIPIYFTTAPPYIDIEFGKPWDHNHPGGRSEWDYLRYKFIYELPPGQIYIAEDSHPIPTLTEIGLLVLVVLLIAVGVRMAVHRRKLNAVGAA